MARCSSLRQGRGRFNPPSLLSPTSTGQGRDDNEAVKEWDRHSSQWWEVTVCPGSSGQVAQGTAKTRPQSPGEWLAAAK